MSRLALATLFGVGCTLLVGCGDPYEGRQAVSGTVTVKGVPLKEASIQFEPVDGQDTRAGGGVSDGKYQIPRDAGLKPGKYLVRLTAGDGKTVDADEDPTAPGGTNIVSVDLIPPEYGSASKQQVEVTAGGANQFDFDLPGLVDPSTRRKGKKR
jgi:hypothetical protein